MGKKNTAELSPVILESLQHGARVAHLATSLFAGLAPLHKLSKKWKHILDMGAQLHDIGWLHGKQAHHKMSAAMIREGHIHAELPLPVDVPKDIRHLVALVARYHRRAEPKLSQARFANLNEKERKAILILAAIIRLADALDFSHTGAVQDIKVRFQQENIHLELFCTKPCSAEIQRVSVKKELFCKIFLMDILCSYTKIK